MNITSPAFVDGQRIPSRYTCDGDNIPPPLEVYDVPAGAKSLALVMHDPDVPKHLRADGVYDHWVVWNIGPDIERFGASALPGGALEGVNTGGRTGYTGPCPPDGEHRYYFTLFALDTELTIPGSSTKAEVLRALEGHIIAEAQLMGRYARTP